MSTDNLASGDSQTVVPHVGRYATGRLRMSPKDLDALRQSDTRYRTIVDRAPIGVVLTDADGLILVANPAFQRMVGYSEDELRNLRFTQITHPDDVASSLEVVRPILAGHQADYSVDKRYIRKDGTVVWARVSLSALVDADGHPQGLIAMQQDITEHRLIEEALRASENRYQQIFDSNRTIQLIVDPQTGGIVDANPAACAYYGASKKDLCATTVYDLNVLSADIIAAEMARAKREGRDYVNHRHRLWSGEVRDIESYSTPVEIDGRTLVYSTIHDITERKRVEVQLRHQALHDSLTGLPNRLLFDDHLGQAILRAQRDAATVALLVMDLNQFNEINNTFGHAVGDLVLQQIAPRLQDITRHSDTVVRLVSATLARLGGDEFAIILPGAKERGATEATDRLLQALNEPILVNEHTIRMSASVGIAIFPEHGRDPIGLQQRANVALHQAKQAYSKYAVYDSTRDEYSLRRHAIASDLRETLEHGKLYLQYQPQITCLTGHTTRVEALARWLHPQYGMISPADFIPLAEQTGLIGQLTTWVLREALLQCAEWRAAGREVGVAVNLSARSLSDPQLPETISQIVDSAGVEFDWLDVEITESAVMANMEHSMRVLQRLHDLGIRISVDDFGTGYSSLMHLRRLPVDAIKIDRSFVVEMAVNEEDAIIVRSVVDLAHNLGLDVVAEGVEDRAAYDMLVVMGCEVAQGYFFARPLSCNAMTEWLAAETDSVPG